MKTLYMIRHGQSEANVNEEVYKQIPDYQIELTDVGVAQAQYTAQLLQDKLMPTKTLKMLYSPWRRATDTAKIIHKHLEEELQKTILSIQDPLIYEQVVCTSYEDMKNKEDYLSKEKLEYGTYWYKTGTSESLADVYFRARQFVSDLRNHPEDQLVVVSHGVFIVMVHAVINNLSVEEILQKRYPNNCEIWEITIE